MELHFGNGGGFNIAKVSGTCVDCGTDFIGHRVQKRCTKCAKARIKLRVQQKAALKVKKKPGRKKKVRDV